MIKQLKFGQQVDQQNGFTIPAWCSNMVKFGLKIDQTMNLPYLHGDQTWSNLVKKGNQIWSNLDKKLIHKIELPYLKKGSNVIKFGQKVDQQQNLP